MTDKFVTFNEGRSTPTGLPQAVDTKLSTRYATKAELNSAIIGTGGVVSPSVSRIIASSNPDTPLAEGDLLLLYPPPMTHFEDWADGLAGWDELWTTGRWASSQIGDARATGSSTRTALAWGPAMGDVEIVARMTVPTISSGAITSAVALRVSGEAGQNNALVAGIHQGGPALGYWRNGTWNQIGDYAPMPATSQVWVRARLHRGIFSARWWDDGTQEPDTWDLSGTPPDLPPGRSGLTPMSNQSVNVWHEVGIAELDTGDELAPVVAP